MLGFEDAEHEESSPEASRLLISKLSCSLVGESERIELKPGTLAEQVYGKEEAVERYSCNYSLNPAYQEQISRGTLKIVGSNSEGAVRVVELEGHRFFMASLFLPQMSSTLEQPHPMITEYLKAAVSFGRRRQSIEVEKAV